MGFSCDFCGKEASIDHKISCERCFRLLLHLLTAFKEAKKEKRIYKKRKVKKKKKKKKMVLSKSIKKIKPEKKTEEESEETEREKLFEKAVLKKATSTDLLTKCATCEFGFMDGEAKKISCTEGKDPKTCGK